MKDNGLEEKPCQVFNMDETGMPLNPHPPKCVFSRGEKNPVSICSGEKTQITVVGCVSAAGYCIPPMIIWDQKQLSLELTTGEVPGTLYGLSMKGWMDQELFDGWLSGHFLCYAPPDRPLLLLVDGHSSHYCPSAIRFAAKEQIITKPSSALYTSMKNHFYKMKRDIGMADYEKLVKQDFHTPSIEFHTPSLYLCFFL